MGVNDNISIGNSDNRLTQEEWSAFISNMRTMLVVDWAGQLQVHGEWFSGPDQPWQNANWCVEIFPPSWWHKAAEQAGPGQVLASAKVAREREMEQKRDHLKQAVKALCLRYKQDSCAWTTGPVELIETGYQPEIPFPPGIEAERRKLSSDAALDQMIREGWELIPGEVSASNPQEPASTGDGEAPEIPGWDKDAHEHFPGHPCPVVDCFEWNSYRFVPVGADAAQARMDALRERQEHRKERQRARHEEMHDQGTKFEDCGISDCAMFWGEAV
jgi:hypothetical protein